MAIIYLEDARIDTMADTDDIITGLMSSGWIIKSKKKDILRNDDITVNIEQGHIKIDLSSIWQQFDDSYVATVNGINVFDTAQYPSNHYSAVLADTHYDCWNTQTGVCTIVQSQGSLFTLETFDESLVPKMKPDISYRDTVFGIGRCIAYGFGFKCERNIYSDENVSIAVDDDGRIKVLCAKVCEDISMACFTGCEISPRRLITQYKRVSLQNSTLSIFSRNGDIITLYLDGNTVTDIDLCAGGVV